MIFYPEEIKMNHIERALRTMAVQTYNSVPGRNTHANSGLINAAMVRKSKRKKRKPTRKGGKK